MFVCDVCKRDLPEGSYTFKPEVVNHKDVQDWLETLQAVDLVLVGRYLVNAIHNHGVGAELVDGFGRPLTRPGRSAE